MKLTKIFHADLSDVHHAAFWLGFFGILADILGLLRDRLLAGAFGASRELDIYYAAFRVPDFLYTLLLLFTASTAIIPIFLKNFQENKEKAAKLLGSIIIYFSLTLLVLSAAAFFFMPELVKLSLPGFSAEDVRRTALLSRILLLSPIFLGFSNIFSSVTQAFRRFFVYGLAPVFYNVGIIFGISIFYQFLGLPGLAWGVALGALAHMALQIPSLRNIGVFPKFKNFKTDSAISKIIWLSLPRTLGLSITQFTTIILTGIASTFYQGSIAVFNLALNLEYIPVTIVGLSYSVAAFPNLVSFSLNKAKDDFKKHFFAAMRHIIFWTLPMSVLIFVLRAQIVRVVLGSGVFSWADTRLTAAALAILSLAIIFQSLFMLLIRAFYAEGESWRPLAINVISALLSVGAAFWFSLEFRAGGALSDFFRSFLSLSGIEDLRIVALPLGILVGSIFNFIFLFFSFRAVFGWFPGAEAGRAILQIISGSLVAGLVSYWGLNIFSLTFDLYTFFGVFLQGFLAGILGILAFLGILWSLGSRELFEAYHGLRGLFTEKQKGREDMVPAPEPEKLL